MKGVQLTTPLIDLWWPLPGPGTDGRRVVQAAEDVDVVAERRERREAGRDVEIRAGLRRDPVALRDAVAVEPEDEAALDRLLNVLAAAPGGVRRAVRIEHAHERRQSDLNSAPGERDTLQERPARKSSRVLVITLRHYPSSLPGNSRARTKRYINSLNLKSDRLKSSSTLRISGRSAGRFRSSRRIPEVLLHDAFLTLRTVGQNGAEFLRRREGRVRQPGDEAGGVEVELTVFTGASRFAVGRLTNVSLQLLAPSADGVELLEAKADRVDQVVATRAALVGRVLGQPLAVGLGLRFA